MRQIQIESPLFLTVVYGFSRPIILRACDGIDHCQLQSSIRPPSRSPFWYTVLATKRPRFDSYGLFYDDVFSRETLCKQIVLYRCDDRTPSPFFFSPLKASVSTLSTPYLISGMLQMSVYGGRGGGGRDFAYTTSTGQWLMLTHFLCISLRC